MRSGPIANSETIYSGNINGIRSDARGGASCLVHQMLGTIAMGTNPSNNQTLTLTINGTAIVITFVTSLGVAANNVLIGATAAATAANLYNFLTNPGTTTSTQVAASSANQTLLSYLSFLTVSTSTIVGHGNKTIYAPFTSLSVATTVTSATWTANTMALCVHPGTVWINGTEVKYAGGSTPTVTAPSTNPRIDVLTIDSSGTLAWTTGVENASPAVPAYPANKVPLCEIYNVVGETKILDNDNQSTSQAYIQYDVRPMIAYPFNPGSVAANILPDADGTRDLGSLSFQFNNIYAKTNIYVAGRAAAISKFGGTGTDGALSISSGTTTLSAGSASYLEKNYTSVSITGTANLAFSSVGRGFTFALRSQGNVTITTSSTHAIDMRGLGGGPDAIRVVDNTVASVSGMGGAGGGSIAGVGVGSNIAIAGASNIHSVLAGPGLPALSPFNRFAPAGGNGCAGTTGGANGFSIGNPGSGGAGGGGLYIECGAAYNFTTGAIDLSGNAGSANTNNVSGGLQGGCGGGGAGGNCLVLYATLTADSGTYNVSGGAGGTGTGASGSAGANGATLRAVNTFHA
ncbi:protein of unknown function [Bradyrhizobium sp. ORS 285]|uniref:hypothetical protein n=1 Tax=Bradyrhizobium sp. ORS 285 TaxID=115808 RepID=UPI000240959E|nr:hypothetical protein [Bradyrhizobium sp. ORS 285]CCD89858.1 hypothetical protein BRAO285_850063 [Bradyrhizobium sp. ORS 285]SMX61514.1 protein of unknown function [Bradyrhizobium sp. ORS 285]